MDRPSSNNDPSGSTLFELLNKVHLRLRKPDTTKNVFDEGGPEKLISVCLPDEMKKYKEVIGKEYATHRIIAHLIYLYLGEQRRHRVDLEKLEEMVQQVLNDV